MILLAQSGLVGFERHVRIAIQLDAHLGVPLKDLVAFLRQLVAQRMSQKNLFQFELPRLELRLDVLHEMEIGSLGFRVVGVAGHRDVTAR